MKKCRRQLRLSKESHRCWQLSPLHCRCSVCCVHSQGVFTGRHQRLTTTHLSIQQVQQSNILRSNFNSPSLGLGCCSRNIWEGTTAQVLGKTKDNLLRQAHVTLELKTRDCHRKLKRIWRVKVQHQKHEGWINTRKEGG